MIATAYPKSLFKRTTCLIGILSLGATLGISVCLPSMAQSGDRWLELTRLRGSVIYQGDRHRAAQIGDRLYQTGQGLSTGRRASSTLQIDSGIGIVTVSENTRFSVRQLYTTSSGGRVTVLDVVRGQARVQVRPFTNPSSLLELHTPGGVAAVRGTEFGVNVSSDGKSSVGTLEGTVEVSGQGESVLVNAGFASVVVPGEPPTAPIPLDQELQLDLVDFHRRNSRLYVQGRINAANSLFVNDQEIAVSRSGWFSTVIPLSRPTKTLNLTVRNPLGDERDYSFSAQRLDINRD